ncbi:unnamed protein product [Dracunculus medinensis]|uniref:Ovule protein n=1 Tax=Dracunculus medinensis TaxID=318479 RepID=A0A0N4U7S3_DRAME|nr:unnamed protein product [Dracunculus medinensis]
MRHQPIINRISTEGGSRSLAIPICRILKLLTYPYAYHFHGNSKCELEKKSSQNLTVVHTRCVTVSSAVGQQRLRHKSSS